MNFNPRNLPEGLIPTFSQGEGHQHTALTYMRSHMKLNMLTFKCSVIKFAEMEIKLFGVDVQHRPVSVRRRDKRDEAD
jgi:hypothetical protein